MPVPLAEIHTEAAWRIKWRLLAWPVFRTAIAFTAGYSLVHWLLLTFTDPNEDLFQWVLPLYLAFGLALWVLRRRMGLMVDRGRNDMGLFMPVVAAACIGVPAVVAQPYVECVGPLTVLSTIQELPDHPGSRFVSLERYYIQRSAVREEEKRKEIRTKNKDASPQFKVSLFMAAPIFSSATDTTTSGPITGWLCLDFEGHVIASSTSPQEDYSQFVNSSRKKFRQLIAKKFSYLRRIPRSNDLKAWQAAARKSGRASAAESVMFQPVYESFDTRFRLLPFALALAFGLPALLWLLCLIRPRLDREEIDRFAQGIYPNDKWQSHLIPHAGFFTTPLLCWLNISLLLLMKISNAGSAAPSDWSTSLSILEWGALSRPLFISGDWWRLLTNSFLNAGFLLLIVNVAALYIVGRLLEPLLGTRRFTVYYLLAALATSLTSIGWHSNTLQLGASGAVAGLFGVLTGLYLKGKVEQEAATIQLVTLFFFALLNIMFSMREEGTDIAAHLGGLIAGIGLGLLPVPPAAERSSEPTTP